MGNLGAIDADEHPWHGYDCSLPVTVPPLGVVLLRPRVTASDRRSSEIAAAPTAASRSAAPVGRLRTRRRGVGPRSSGHDLRGPDVRRRRRRRGHADAEPARGDERAAPADDPRDVRRHRRRAPQRRRALPRHHRRGPRLLRRRRLPGDLPRRGPRQPQGRPPGQPHQARRVVARRHLRPREADDRRPQRARRRLRHGHRPVLRHPHRLDRAPSSAGSSCAAA